MEIKRKGKNVTYTRKIERQKKQNKNPVVVVVVRFEFAVSGGCAHALKTTMESSTLSHFTGRLSD